VLTLLEATKVFKVSVPTMYRWIKQDIIPYKVVNGTKYYNIDALQNAYEKRHGSL
jgi:predicted site-specific integrase-resolvase